MNKKLMDILEDLARHSHQAKGTDSYYPICTQVHDQIIGLFRECLPKKAEHEIRNGEYEDGFVDGINRTIDQAQKNMN